jgi:hypothetical protein
MKSEKYLTLTCLSFETDTWSSLTIGAPTLGLMTFSITPFSIKDLLATLSKAALGKK